MILIGQQLFYDALVGSNNPPNFTVRLYAPSGRQLYNGSVQNDAGLDQLTLTETGQYSLVVDGNGAATGAYSFQLLDKATGAKNLSLSNVPITGGYTALDSGSISSNFNINSNNQALDADLYSFYGSAGELVYLHNTQSYVGNRTGNRWILYAPNGQYIGSNPLNVDDELTLSATGQYTLVMQGTGDNISSGGAYSSELDLYLQQPSQPLTLNQVVSGNISYPGENDIYTFNGTIGQQLFYDALVGSNNPPNFTVRLYAPSGRQLYNGSVQNDAGLDQLTLTETGQYSLVIDGNGAATGVYSFRLLNKNDAPSLSFNTSINGSFGTNKLNADIYTFTGTPGEQIAVQNINDGSSDNWILYAPDGVKIGSNNLATNQQFTLSANGQYALVMQGQGYDSSYTVQVNDLGNTNPPQSNITTTPLTLNQVINGSIALSQNNDIYTFTGTVGEQLFYNGLNGNNFTVQLYSPSGKQLYSGSAQNDIGPDALNLIEAGQYSLVIVSNGAKGAYSFRLSDKATGTINPLNSVGITDGFTALDSGVVNGSFNTYSNNQDTNLYTFNGISGESLYLHNLAYSYFDSWYLYAPNGQIVSSNNLFTDGAITLSQTGQYLLAREGGGNGSTDSFQLDLYPQQPTQSLTLNQLVSNNLLPGERDSYTFTGIVGEQLFYNGLNGNNFTVQLYSPSGKQLYSGSAQNDIGPDALNLIEAGQYSLVIVSNGAKGAYSFRLSDKATGTINPLNSVGITDGFTALDSGVVNGSFNTYSNNQDTNLYTFNGISGESLYLHNLAYSYFDSWYLYAPNGQIVSSNNLFTDGAITLSQTGQYLLAREGGGNGSTDSFQLDLYPQQPTQSLTLNQLVSNNLLPGERDSYTFTGIVGEQLFYNGLNGNNFTVQLYSPSGKQLYSGSAQNDIGPDALNLIEAGQYSLVIVSNGAKGAYSFRLSDKATGTINPLNSVGITDGFTALDSGVVNGSFNTYSNNQDTNLYTFNGISGESLYLHNLAYSYFDSWYLYAPNGQIVSSNNLFTDGAITLSQTGQYLLAREGGGNGSTDSFQLDLYPQQPTQSLTLNQLVSNNLLPGERDSYTFTGIVGEQLFYNGLNGNNFTVQLYSPSGKQLYSGSAQNDIGPDALNLIEAGQYSLVIVSNGAKGAYSFRLSDKATGTINPLNSVGITDGFTALDSGVVNGSFNTYSNNQDTNLYTFNGISGESLYLHNLAYSYFDSWYLYAPNGQIVSSNNLFTDGAITLSQTGQYLLAREGGGNGSTDSFQLDLYPQQPTQSLTLNQVVSGKISLPGENDTYTFQGTAGEQLFYDALINSNPNLNVQLYTPSGKQVYGGQAQRDQGPEYGFTLAETGQYSLIINGNYGTIGAYSFRLLNKDDAPSIIYNSVVTGSFGSNELDTDLYTFSGNQGQQIYLQNQGGNPNDHWYLYKPDGQFLALNNQSQDALVTLPSTGEYLLSMQGSGNGNSGYKFELFNPQQLTENLTLNQLVSGNISLPGESDTYKFTGSIGQELYFDALTGNPNLKVSLIAPSGTLINQAENNDWGVETLIEAGTYQLVINGVGATTGNYSFTLSDLSAVTTLTLGKSITGTLNPGNSTALYQFNGNSGQTLNFNLQSATQWTGANWVLYDPTGHAIESPSANSPNFRIGLPENGDYTLAIIGNSTNAVNYSFETTDTTIASVNTSGLGTVETLTPGQTLNYSFTANAGTSLLYDSLTNAGINVSLVNPDGSYVSQNFNGGADQIFHLQQTGNYTVELQNNSGGNYQFELKGLPKTVDPTVDPSVNYLTLGAVVADTLNGLTDKIYTFQAVNGLRIMFHGMVGDGMSATLYDSSGNQVFNSSNFNWSDNGSYTLTQNDVYNLVISNNRTYSNNYSFEVLPATLSQPLAYNVVNNDAISSGGGSSIYRFTVSNPGDIVYVQNLSTTAPNGNYQWQIYGPGNQQLANQYQGTDLELVAPEAGEYLLYIKGANGSGADNNQFKIFDNQQALPDVIVPGITDPPGSSDGSLGIVPVELQVKDSKGGIGTQDYNIRIWPDPNNGNPVIISTPVTSFGLNEQTFLYQVKAIDPNQDTLAYRLVNGPVGAVINKDTGEIVWTPDSTVKPGSQSNFTVEVDDGRGGKDTQSFAVNIYGALGTIEGAVFNDLNANGILDTKLVQGNDPVVVFVIDNSGSSIAPFHGTGQYANVKTVLDAQIVAAEALINTVIAEGAGNSIRFSIITQGENAIIQDLDPNTPGVQAYTTALANPNANGTPYIIQVLENLKNHDSTSYQSALSQGNDFTTALDEVTQDVQAFSGTPNIIFMSDGYGPLDAVEAQKDVTTIEKNGGHISAFAIGQASTLATLQEIDPNAIQLTDINQLAQIFEGYNPNYTLEPFIEGATVYLDLNNDGKLDPGDPFQVTKQNAAPNSIGNVNYNYFTFSNLQPGTYTVRTILPNGYQLTAPSGSTGFTDTITVNGETITNLFGISQTSSPPHQDPIFTTTAPALSQVSAGQLLRYNANAQSPDASPLTYELLNAPDGMTIDPTTGTVVWVPTEQQVNQAYTTLAAMTARLDARGRGAYAPTVVEYDPLVVAEDNQGGKALQYLTVDLLPLTYPPSFTSTFPSTAQPQVGKQFTYQVTAVSPNPTGGKITFSGVGLPKGATIDPQTGLLTWTPTSAARLKFCPIVQAEISDIKLYKVD